MPKKPVILDPVGEDFDEVFSVLIVNVAEKDGERKTEVVDESEVPVQKQKTKKV